MVVVTIRHATTGYKLNARLTGASAHQSRHWGPLCSSHTLFIQRHATTPLLRRLKDAIDANDGGLASLSSRSLWRMRSLGVMPGLLSKPGMQTMDEVMARMLKKVPLMRPSATATYPITLLSLVVTTRKRTWREKGLCRCTAMKDEDDDDDEEDGFDPSNCGSVIQLGGFANADRRTTMPWMMILFLT